MHHFHGAPCTDAALDDLQLVLLGQLLQKEAALGDSLVARNPP